MKKLYESKNVKTELFLMVLKMTKFQKNLNLIQQHHQLHKKKQQRKENHNE
ncbi:hypothetical protein ONA00_02935 [Mycoplasmopsis cynos]|nr:hypothetical protein [Mycoplasmopsis cynos]WAM11397.1 hypothetical protein ONA00_02935 [Mycoplasmopsis cynos]